MRCPRDSLVPGLSLALALGVTVHGCRRRAPERVAVADAAVSAQSAVEPSAPTANVTFRVHDPTGRTIPCKLTLLGRDGTPTPDLGFGQPTRSVDGGLAAHHRVFSLTGQGAVSVPSGNYDLWVSRGPEWSLHQQTLTVRPEPQELTVTLTRLVSREGWVSADAHVHADPSWDSKVPLGARVHEFVSEGVDVLIATDHNVVTDYRPEIERAGAKGLLETVLGSELSTTDWGHFGAFPLKHEQDWWVLHGVRMTGTPADQLLRAVRRHGPTALVTVNHPRLGKLGYFNVGGFEPKSARFAHAHVSFEFDAVEVMNGAKHGSLEAVDRVMADWFGLLADGRRITAMGNSDTHELIGSYAGYPRNYVRLADSSVDGERLAAALREGASFFSSGPFVEAKIGEKSLGELARAESKQVTLSVKVRAAAWVSVVRLRVYVNGQVAKDQAIAPSDETERFSGDLPLETPDDAFVVVRVDGDRPLPPVVGGPPADTLFPVAVTNPIYVDADGDGKWKPRKK
ncbi:MAG: CehA/McbA family metallohydrolase [Polyangiaceae bacterium]|nr:CehA/McbA family metallohydrolase [Polyangiaceae bacterium]